MTNAEAQPEGMALFRPFRRLYKWVLSWADSPYGLLALAVLGFCEAIFFPVPPDALLIALCLGARKKSWMFALVCTLASVVGALGGYFVGYAFFEVAAQPILELYGKTAEFESLSTEFRKVGDVGVFVAAVTPMPFKLVTVTSGAVGISLVPFVVACFLGRGIRFFLVAGLIAWRGESMAQFIEKYFEALMVLFIVLLIGGIFALKGFI